MRLSWGAALRHGLAGLLRPLTSWLLVAVVLVVGLQVLDALQDATTVAAEVTTTVVVGAGLVAVLAVVSAVYIGAVYSQRSEDAPFLALLVRLCIRVSVAAAIVLAYIALALSGFSLGKPWGAIVIALPVSVMMTVPTTVARLWRDERDLPL